ncbi:Anxa6 protein [Perkinsela sp. CCAP 1560/4]|nr:hypothetical protein XU18_3731 [Perkinsela sp. CCAP 1560/4]KNH08345.1 Anxa6 protein [Perkinsela sp. CCAP 1560/4]|eukprot:KNH05168.1 hypothetical protein XU18_3731 [Perkinsela sp. CCAP 1560/4]
MIHITSKLYEPKPDPAARGNAPTASKEFVDESLLTFHGKREVIADKKVIIILDGAREHGRDKDMITILQDRPHYIRLHSPLVAEGGFARLLKGLPNSPQLNLCE